MLEAVRTAAEQEKKKKVHFYLLFFYKNTIKQLVLNRSFSCSSGFSQKVSGVHGAGGADFTMCPASASLLKKLLEQRNGHVDEDHQ